MTTVNAVPTKVPFETGFALLRITRFKVICFKFDEHSIRPVIDKREMWKDQKHRILFPERYDVFCYDESDRVFCSCPAEQKGNIRRALRDATIGRRLLRTAECTEFS